MVKMIDLRRTVDDVKEEKSALGEKSEAPYVPPEDDGARFDLDHHHLTKMGVGGDLKSGDSLIFNGRGTVERSESRSTPDGDRHSATIRFHRGGVDHQQADRSRDEGSKDLRNEIEQVHGKAQEAAEGKMR
jgi:hypothetical protein